MFKHLKESDSVFNKNLKREYYLFSKSGFDEKIKKFTNIRPIDLIPYYLNHCPSIELYKLDGTCVMRKV